jgi:Bacterial type II and III secretion system protein/FG-GAP-like repeat
MANRFDRPGRPGAAHLRPAAVVALVALFSLAGLVISAARAQDPVPASTPSSDVRPDAKKAKAAFEQGARAERQGDWSTAYTDYTDAANYAPSNRAYAIHRELAKSRVVQSKMDAAERDAISGRLDEAQKQLLSASFIDPLNPAIRKRLAELATAEISQIRKTPQVELGGELTLDYKPGTRNFDYRGDTQGAYQELARQFGVEVGFDVDMRSRQVRFQVTDVDFPTAARLLGDETGTFWRPLSARLFFVAEGTAQKRKDFEPSVVRTILLPASETPEQMTEIVRLVRDVTGITRADLNAASRTLTLRASPHAVALATDLIDDLEKPTGEMILEIEILEVDRTGALNLGIVPPQSAQVFTVSTQQIEEAAASEEGLIDVIEQVLGTTTPNVIAFGGGYTTFFATLPNAAANFSQMLSLVRTGRRILLRAQDGKTADFFVGERYPVSLATFSPSLLNGSITGAGTGINNPLTNYAVGNTPSYITTNILRGDSSVNDLIVANSTDNTVSILLGNGDGTFANQVAYPLGAATDKDPVWIATGAFDTPNDSNIDLAVANEGSNTVSILLGQTDSTTSLATGTFVSGTDLVTGNSPVSVVAADFHDLANTGFLDLAVANQADDTISIFQGNGNGTFKPPTVVPLIAGFEPTALATGNFTNSGHVDLIVAEKSNTAGNAGQIQVLLGNGDGTFTQAPNSPYAAGNTPVFIATGDFNGDGVTDLAVADNGPPSTSSSGTGVAGNAVSIYFGNPNTTQVNFGNGTFSAQNLYAAGTSPTSIAVADYNQDGFLDLAVSDSSDNAVTLLFNEGTGVFTSTTSEIPVGAAPLSIVTADFNGDGLPDAATADSGAAEATVILNSASLFPSSSSQAGTAFPGAQYLDIGLKVKATPRIHPDSEVTLDLAFEISSLSAQSYNQIPVINNESVTQTVRLKQDETAAVAGFRSTQLSNAITGNPGISQIPGVGLLDQNTTNNSSDTQLLILVTPRMVRYAPRTDHIIYAGQGEPQGQGGAETAPNIVAPPNPPAPAPPPPENAPQQQPPAPAPPRQPGGQAPPQQPDQNGPAPLQPPPPQ